jgi:trk system potassium uptake protein TrkH
LSIQTKTVLLTTLLLIVSGASMFAFLEQLPLTEGRSAWHRILTPLFQSITCRTAGFNTVDIASLKSATLAVMIFLMFFGASPGSCGGGVKTTTLALLAAFTVSRLRRQRRVNLFKKSIPHETINRSVSLVLVSTSIICLVLFMILAGNAVDSHQFHDRQGDFLKLLFETVSAFGTVGLSMGVTPELNMWGKSWIIAMMIIGRVGVLTFSYIIVGTGSVNGIEHSEENLMIG